MDKLILALAVFRIAYMFTQPEEGPFDIVIKFRHWIGVRYDERSEAYGQNEFAKVFTCIYCLSVWLAIIATGLYWYNPVVTTWLAMPFALSAVAMVMKRCL